MTKICIGTDIAEDQLEVMVSNEEVPWPVPPDAVGLTELCTRLTAVALARIIMEATDGLQGYSFQWRRSICVRPRHMCLFHRSMGQA